MFVVIVLLIIAIIITVKVHNKSPQVVAKREAAERERQEQQENADKLIRGSEIAEILGTHFVKNVFAQDSEIIKFLRGTGNFVQLTTERHEVRLLLDSDYGPVHEQLRYDEDGHRKDLDEYSSAILFKDHDWENLPNGYMVIALQKYLLETLDTVEYLTVSSNKITYTPKKTSWSVMPT